MALACGSQARAVALSVELTADAPVGAFLEVEASTGEWQAGTIAATATATSEGRPVAEAQGRFELEQPV
jgi:hypothetical protein